METKKQNTTTDDVKVSVASLYANLLSKRKAEQEAKEEEKLRKMEEKRLQKEEEQNNPESKVMTKEEKRKAALDSWKEIVVGLTGDDLDYVKEKKSKKKYRRWIDDDTDGNQVIVKKNKKPKKRNYNKEFEAELSLLKSLVSEQNKFTTDLQKRFTAQAGPNTKDAMPLNKTLVDLAATINSSRANSLGVIREIGSIKKTIADLYMRQKKLDSELGNGSGVSETTDIGILGSSIANNLFGDNGIRTSGSAPQHVNEFSSLNTPASTGEGSSAVSVQPVQQSQSVGYEEFDPSTWNPNDIGVSASIKYENAPHEVIVEWDKQNDRARFKAINPETGDEIPDYPLPTSDITRLKFDEEGKKVKGQFDEIYRLDII